jgi:hypothetical protein
LLNGP